MITNPRHNQRVIYYKQHHGTIVYINPAHNGLVGVLLDSDSYITAGCNELDIEDDGTDSRYQHAMKFL